MVNRDSDPDGNKRLLILRHGETDGNLRRIIQQPDTPLNARGQEQARLAAQRIVAQYGTRLVVRSSDYRRAQQTALALATCAQVEILVDPLLRERDLGDLRGRTYQELGFDPFAPGYQPPAGESWDEFFARVAKCWSSAAEQMNNLPKGYTLVWVTHGLVCRALATNHLVPGQVSYPSTSSQEHAANSNWPNTSLTVLEHTATDWRIVTINCSRHLGQPNAVPGAIA